jgi:hypothetical protein
MERMDSSFHPRPELAHLVGFNTVSANPTWRSSTACDELRRLGVKSRLQLQRRAPSANLFATWARASRPADPVRPTRCPGRHWSVDPLAAWCATAAYMDAARPT